MNNKVTFKPYDMNQLKLPIDLAIDIPENHLVKIVNRAIERMNLTPLLKKYKGGGTSAYHPLMMLKVLVYAYTQKIYTARKIAKALRERPIVKIVVIVPTNKLVLKVIQIEVFRLIEIRTN